MPVASCSICFEPLLPLDNLTQVTQVTRVTQVTQVTRAPSSSSDDDTASCASTIPCEPTRDVTDVSSTPCGHVFHTACVSTWLSATHNHCPQCRPAVTTKGLIRLFFTEEQKAGSSKVGQSGTLDRREKEENKIILDVLQCQLEDLEQESQKLKKQLAVVEDQLQEKVQEVSLSEEQVRLLRLTNCDLSDQLRTKENELSSNAQELRGRLDSAEKDNAQLRQQVYDLRERERAQDLQLRNRDSQCQELQTRATELERNVQANLRTITDLQIQLDSVHHLSDGYSIYESLTDVRVVPHKRPKNVFGCFKCAVIIAVVLAVVVSLLVVIPLKIIFTE